MLGPSISWGFCCSSETIKLFPLWTLINIWTHGAWAQCVTFPTLGKWSPPTSPAGMKYGSQMLNQEKSQKQVCRAEIQLPKPASFDISVTCSTSLWGERTSISSLLFPPPFQFCIFGPLFILSLIIFTLYFNICTCFRSHPQKLVLSLLVEIWEPYIGPLCCRQRRY